MIWTDAAQWLAPRPVARATLVLGALPAAVWWPAPWKLLIKTTIDEMPPPGAQTTQLGEFTSHIHPTSGTARLATSPDGSRILRLDNLHATLGPQLRVWLSDARVANGRGRFRRSGLSHHTDLSPLRANRGNANYLIPGDVDTAGVGSVILWCARFGVSFGAAELRFVPQSLDTPLRGLTVRPA